MVSELNRDISRIYFLGIGSAVLICGAGILLVSSLLFWAGVTINVYEAPLGIVFSLVFICLYWKRCEISGIHLFLLLFLYLSLICASIAISGAMYDLSYDGQAIHQEAIMQLVQGYNPVSGIAYGDQALWINHYPKGNWIIGAAIYKLTGNIETGKVFNILYLISSFFLSVVMIMAFSKQSLFLNLLLAAIISFNPVSLYQALSFYQDGQVASLLLCFIVSGILLITADRKYIIPLISFATSAIILINLKFTALVYVIVIGTGLFLSFFSMRSSWKIYAKSFLGVLILGAVLIGYNPFVRNLVEHQNIFYPLMGKGKQDIISDKIPANFASMNRFEKLYNSIFSKSENIQTPDNSSLKIPVIVNKSELGPFDQDIRVGGFGPWFGLIFILSHIILVYLLIQKKVSSNWLLLYLVIVASIIINPEAWWARYAPQMWFVPSIILFISFQTKQNYFIKIANGFLIIFFITNIVMVAYPHISEQIKLNKILDNQLSILASLGKPLAVDFNKFNSNELRFKKRGIAVFETQDNKCNQRLTIVKSLAYVCFDNVPLEHSGVIQSYSFSDGTGGWTPTEGISLSQLKTPDRNNNAALLINGAAHEGSWSYASSPVFDLKPGRLYKLSADMSVRSIDNKNYPPFVKCELSGDSKFIGNFTTQQYSLAGDDRWQHLSVIFITPLERNLKGSLSVEKGVRDVVLKANITVADIKLEMIGSY